MSAPSPRSRAVKRAWKRSEFEIRVVEEVIKVPDPESGVTKKAVRRFCKRPDGKSFKKWVMSNLEAPAFWSTAPKGMFSIEGFAKAKGWT